LNKLSKRTSSSFWARLSFQRGLARSLFLAHQSAIAVLALVDDAVAAIIELPQLIGLVQQTQSPSAADVVLELLQGASAELVRLHALLSDDGRPHDAAVPVLTAATPADAALLIVREAQVVPDGVGQIGGQDVRLEDVDVHADAGGLPAANGAHGGRRALAALESLATEMRAIFG